MTKTALVAGSTGMVGSHIIRQLAAHPDYDEVIALCRQAPDNDWKSLAKVTIKTVDFDQLEQELKGITVDEIYCCLGTTTKKSPSKKQYQKVDRDYPIALAKAGLAAGANYYGFVSAMGTSQYSLSNYLRYKGKVEHFLKQSSYPHIAIAQPSLLLGERNEFRLAETVFSVFTPIMPNTIKPIEGGDVAGALIRSANPSASGITVLTNKDMHGQALTSKKS